MSREIKLPATRQSVSHDVRIAGHRLHITVGTTEDGQPAELFIKTSKQGSTLNGLIAAFCRSFSLALQYGLPLSKAVAKFKDMRFEPCGPTDNLDIPEAASIPDYVVRFIEQHWSTDHASSKA